MKAVIIIDHEAQIVIQRPAPAPLADHTDLVAQIQTRRGRGRVWMTETIDEAGERVPPPLPTTKRAE